MMTFSNFVQSSYWEWRQQSILSKMCLKMQIQRQFCSSNAFKSLNYLVALHNIRLVCPPFAINTYRSPASSLVSNEVILSDTKGDPLAMSFPDGLTSPCCHPGLVRYADDDCACGSIKDLHLWYVELALCWGALFFTTYYYINTFTTLNTHTVGWVPPIVGYCHQTLCMHIKSFTIPNKKCKWVGA